MNADYRIFHFVALPDGKLILKEQVETEENGGGMGTSWKGLGALEDGDFPA